MLQLCDDGPPGVLSMWCMLEPAAEQTQYLQVLQQASTFPGCSAPFGVIFVVCKCQHSLLSEAPERNLMDLRLKPARSVHIVIDDNIDRRPCCHH